MRVRLGMGMCQYMDVLIGEATGLGTARPWNPPGWQLALIFHRNMFSEMIFSFHKKWVTDFLSQAEIYQVEPWTTDFHGVSIQIWWFSMKNHPALGVSPWNPPWNSSEPDNRCSSQRTICKSGAKSPWKYREGTEAAIRSPKKNTTYIMMWPQHVRVVR